MPTHRCRATAALTQALPAHEAQPAVLLVLGLAGAVGLQRLDRRPLTPTLED